MSDLDDAVNVYTSRHSNPRKSLLSSCYTVPRQPPHSTDSVTKRITGWVGYLSDPYLSALSCVNLRHLLWVNDHLIHLQLLAIFSPFIPLLTIWYNGE